MSDSRSGKSRPADEPVASRSERESGSYFSLLRSRDMRLLVYVMTLVRVGANMWDIAIVLLVLDRFDSPSLAGLVIFMGFVPGLLLSPVGGALLDSYRRSRLVMADLLIQSLAVAAIGVLSSLHLMTSTLLVVLVGCGSITISLAVGGMRAILPTLVPDRARDRANALDSAIGKVTVLLSPLLVGAVAYVFDPAAAMITIAVLWIAAAACAVGIRDRTDGRLQFRGARGVGEGLRFLFRNRRLRNLALLVPLSRIASGVLVVAMPVVVIASDGGRELTVGAMWTVFGCSALAASLAVGRLDLSSREPMVMAGGFALSGVSLAALAWAAYTGGLVGVSVAMALAGMANGSSEVAMLSYRQRLTTSGYFGRVITVSDSIYMLGPPFGSLLAGGTLAWSLIGTLSVGSIAMFAGVAGCLIVLTDANNGAPPHRKL